MSKIVTHCEFPPIPDRRFDWAAYYEGQEEGDVGRGPTEQAAIDDLLNNYDAADRPIAASWRCFHCGQVFTDYLAAQAHFGKTPTDDPECLKELHRLGPHLLEARRDRNEARRALKLALDHIEHMAAWVGKQGGGYSFESLEEDMPVMRKALAASLTSPVEA